MSLLLESLFLTFLELFLVFLPTPANAVDEMTNTNNTIVMKSFPRFMIAGRTKYTSFLF